MYYNVYFELCAALMLTIFTIFARISNPLKKPQNIAFTHLSIFIICSCLSDCAAALSLNEIHEKQGFPLWICYALNIFYFILSGADGYVALKYLSTLPGNEKNFHGISMILWAIPAAIFAAFVIPTPWTRWIFYIDNGAYVYGKFHFMTVVVPTFYMLASMLVLIRGRKHLTWPQFYSAMIFSISTLLGMYIQNIFMPDILMGCCAAAMSIIMLYFSLQTPDSYVLLSALKELRAAKEKAETASLAKEKFLAQISHEMRTPINGMLGMNEMIIRKSTDREITEYSTLIRRSGKTLLQLINDILDYTKLNSGNVKLCVTPYKTALLLNAVCDGVKEALKDKPVRFDFSAETDIPSVLKGDELRIKQILDNLLTNAAKYTNKGFVKLAVKSHIDENGMAVLSFSVTDSGIGIKKEDISRIPESFIRLDDSCTTEGTGLGLSISSDLLRLMNSHLEIESEFKVGSTFSFSITQEIADETPIEAAAFDRLTCQNSNSSAMKFTAPEARVLVVDDSEINLFVVQKLLEQTHIQIDIAPDGGQAYEMASDRAYDIIFLDHMMPHPDGEETLRMLKNNPDCASIKAKIIVLTANAVVGAKEHYLSEGFDDYVSKPVDYNTLEKMLIKHLSPKFIRMERCAENDRNKNTAEYFSEADLSVLNTKIGMRYCRGDSEMYRELLDVYITNCGNYINRLNKDIKNRDMADYAICSHAIRSSSRNIGAEKLSDIAKLQELFAKQDNFNEIISVHEMFTDTISLVISEAEHCLNSSEKPEESKAADEIITEISIAELLSRLRKISDKLYYFEEKEARNELMELKNFSCSGNNCCEIAMDMLNKLDIFDVDGASAIVNGWIAQLAP